MQAWTVVDRRGTTRVPFSESGICCLAMGSVAETSVSSFPGHSLPVMERDRLRSPGHFSPPWSKSYGRFLLQRPTSHGSEPRMCVVSLLGHLAISGAIFGRHNLRRCCRHRGSEGQRCC